jgi:hypothetical protein
VILPFWLSKQPRVLYCIGNPQGELPSWWADEPLTIIITLGGCLSAVEARTLAQQYLQRFAPHEVLLLVPDVKVATQAGHPNVLHIPEHVVLDGSFWDIAPGATQYYDAIIVGQVETHKRHGLAAAVPRLCCVAQTYFNATTHARRVRRELSQAVFPFEPGTGWLPRQQLRGLYHQSRSGLLLSGVEACARVAGEYQLCGLPIVACGSHAGSLSCSDPDFIRIVPPTTTAVAAAVAEVVAARFDPLTIRDAFLSRMNYYRHKLEERVGCALNWRGYPTEPLWVLTLATGPAP